jgi:DNA-directed RNA polymerase specialized sigma24 family protein
MSWTREELKLMRDHASSGLMISSWIEKLPDRFESVIWKRLAKVRIEQGIQRRTFQRRTDAEKEQALVCYEEGKPLQTIAQELGRTLRAVESKMFKGDPKSSFRSRVIGITAARRVQS